MLMQQQPASETAEEDKMKKIKMWQWLALLVVGIISFSGLFHYEEQAAEGPYPNKPVTLIVSYGEGGVTDLGARILRPYVEKELGVPVRIVNVNGEAGWAGWKQLLASPADGYTLAYINTPSLITGYLNPQNKRIETMDDFSLIANQVIDYGAIAIRPQETRFHSVDELVAYAVQHEVTATSTGLASDEHLAMLKLNKAFGTNFIAVQAANTGRLKHGVIDGHIDVYFGNVGELTLAHKSGELTVIAVLAPERSEFLPGVPTVEEVTGSRLYSWAARGVAGPAGLPREREEILTAAFINAMNTEDCRKKMQEAGLALRPMDARAFRSLLEKDEASVRSVSGLLNWE